jgi:F-type H+-transporting ATPase subunit alpha
MAAFAQFGSDLDATTQRLLNRGARLTELLKQAQYSPLTFEEQTLSIFAGTAGYLDSIATRDVTRYEAAMLAHMRQHHADLLTTIRDSRDFGDEVKGKVKDALEAFGKTFA